MNERAEYDRSTYTPARFDGELAGVLSTEFSDRFVDAMRNRMIVSFYKYGPVSLGYPGRVDALASLEKRIAKYRETGNAEWLVDVANFAMIEFMHPRHESAHFRSTDSDESPGRTRSDDGDEHGENVPADGAVESLRAKYGRRDGD